MQMWNKTLSVEQW